ncbi:MAG: hypothetical protein HY537_12535 [Deltaproteobacteria bacterium]|nr:hypothetical protein [Deltaproteobacteria bacterium]
MFAENVGKALNDMKQILDEQKKTDEKKANKSASAKNQNEQQRFEAMYNEYAEDTKRQQSIARRIMNIIYSLFGMQPSKGGKSRNTASDEGYFKRLENSMGDLMNGVRDLFAMEVEAPKKK